MIDFQQKLEDLKNSLNDNIGTGKDSKKEESNNNKPKEIIEQNEILEEILSEKIEEAYENSEALAPYSKQLLEKVHNLEERVKELEIQIKVQEKPLIESLPRKIQKEITVESQLFISMLDIYFYSVIINPKLKFKNPLYQQYKENLTIISQNILANSFRFFEKDSILDTTIQIGKEIEKIDDFENSSLHKIQSILEEMKSSLKKPSYQKNFYFAQFLNERGLILNSVAIINEILGEYIVAAAKNLSIHANERIQVHLDRINNSQTSRRAYYHFYKSVINFFYIQFNTQTEKQEVTFFPYKDTGNKEIEMRFKRMFQANKRSKAELFSLYSEMIYRIKIIRNDLVHGNYQRHYHNISYELEDVLIDFKYLAIHKNFLGA